MSNFAFGTYRVTDLNPQHIEALKEALYGGVRLIDTATNYMDGGAERAIAHVMNTLPYEIRDEIEIVSKFGYIQGTLLAKHKQNPFEDVVQHSESCYHSIAKSFLHNQLDETLGRLELEKIGCYLIHNPEYFLYECINKKMDKEDMLDKMYARIYEAFTGLEEEVQQGRIGSYGISSNSFALSSSAVDFLPYEDLLTLAQNAAIEVGNKTHSFTTIQLPINILETQGLQCAQWAKANGLRVLVNRPLSGQKDGLLYRLAEYDEPHNYYHALNELLDICNTDKLKKLYTIVEQMDLNKHKYGWIGDYDTFLYGQILPHMQETLQQYNDETLELLLQYIDNFLDEYRKMVQYECSKMTRTALKQELQGCQKKIQLCALEYLKQQNVIDTILVGMRKPTYVSEVLSLNR